jgi:hypothetical protein
VMSRVAASRLLFLAEFLESRISATVSRNRFKCRILLFCHSKKEQGDQTAAEFRSLYRVDFRGWRRARTGPNRGTIICCRVPLQAQPSLYTMS